MDVMANNEVNVSSWTSIDSSIFLMSVGLGIVESTKNPVEVIVWANKSYINLFLNLLSSVHIPKVMKKVLVLALVNVMVVVAVLADVGNVSETMPI